MRLFLRYALFLLLRSSALALRCCAAVAVARAACGAARASRCAARGDPCGFSTERVRTRAQCKALQLLRCYDALATLLRLRLERYPSAVKFQ